MAFLNSPIQLSFIQFTDTDNSECEQPEVCLPMAATSDLAFQVHCIVSGADLNYMMNFFNEGPLSFLGKIGAYVSVDGQTARNNPGGNPGPPEWICTGLSHIGSVPLLGEEYVLWMQPTGVATGFDFLENDECFNVILIETAWSQASDESYTVFAGGIYPAVASSFTCFTKIVESCENYPTSVLQYANNSDAFGFYYDYLIELVDQINFLNSIRLPMYLHSPEQTEDQKSYSKSDGSSLKLSHRIWKDYKFKTDYLTTQQIDALIAATAHDFLFVIDNYANLNPFIGYVIGIPESAPYVTNITPTQLVRTEKVAITWYQKDIISFRKGMAEGTLRLAQANEYVNSYCG